MMLRDSGHAPIHARMPMLNHIIHGDHHADRLLMERMRRNRSQQQFDDMVDHNGGEKLLDGSLNASK